MTALSLAARNLLAQDTALKSLLGRSQSWDTWIFDERPVKVAIEGTSTCMIVLNQGSQWTTPNEHNTMRFPTLIVDVWADPTRIDKLTIAIWDATSKIEVIQKHLDRHFHRVDNSSPSGDIIFWGTQEEIESRTGIAIAGSTRRSGPDFSPVSNSEGTFMGRLVYGVNAL